MADPISIDLNRLLKLRLDVARFGEMDVAKWWNTNGILGRHGTMVLKRGFPSTHFFAQARIAFAVARTRCNELFAPPNCITLWNLPADLEDRFEEQWQSWLDEGEAWAPLFNELAAVTDSPTLNGTSLLDLLARQGLVTTEQMQAISRLHRSAEGRAIALPGTCCADDSTLTLLAAAFACGESGRPVVPYARLEGWP